MAQAKPDDIHGPGRFLVVGLPRSGSTYLMTLLNAHPHIHCSGEQFNPYAVVGIAGKDKERKVVWERDQAPLAFMKRFFEDARNEHPAAEWLGFKFMVGHNVRLLRNLAEFPEMRLIYIWRRNKLAQVSSLIKAANSQRWAQSKSDRHVDQKIDAGPLQISHRWHEFSTYDTLMPPFLDALPNKCLTLEYCDMFTDGFEQRLCDFLDIELHPEMKSPLVKQGANRILDRFEDPERIETYFRNLGFENWLENEL